MKRDVSEFVAKCMTCQQVKAEHLRPGGLLRSLPIPQGKWEHISMDFVDGFPRSVKGNESIWVIVCRLTKVARFIPVPLKRTSRTLAELYMREVYRFHGVPVSIVSDRDPCFTSAYWKGLFEALGVELAQSSAYHPESDGQTERVNQILEDMLRACVLDAGTTKNWESHLHLVEFAYNNSYQSSICMAPFEALYGRPCRSPVCWGEVGDAAFLGPDLVRDTANQIALIRQRMKTAQSRQASYADTRRRKLEFASGDWVFLKVSPMRGTKRFGLKGKLAPRFVGPFQIVQKIGDVAYRLDLPASMKVHPVFHVSMLRRCVRDSSQIIPVVDIELRDDCTFEQRPRAIVDSDTRNTRRTSTEIVKVQWSEDPSDCTWNVRADMEKKYPELFDSLPASRTRVTRSSRTS